MVFGPHERFVRHLGHVMAFYTVPNDRWLIDYQESGSGRSAGLRPIQDATRGRTAGCTRAAEASPGRTPSQARSLTPSGSPS